MPEPVRSFGWRPSLPDHRDFHFGELAPQALRGTRPAVKSLIPPPVLNQRSLGACVEHGVLGAVHYILASEGAPNSHHLLSRLQLYYGARGGVPEDTGSTIRDAIKAFAAQGCGIEDLWPYSDEPSIWKKMPPSKVYKEGAYRATGFQYGRVSVSNINNVINHGFPVIFGMSVYPSFQPDADGVIPMPKRTEEPEGGHCMLITGYDDHRRMRRVLNSWGPDWGDQGSCWIPYAMWEQGYAWEHWTIMRVSK